jgi:ribosomal protein S18 acetylase RimI-like enzyme
MISVLALEELSMNAWPALKTHLYDGWVLRFANGYTKRANSVHPIYPSALPMEEKIVFCESLYGREGLPSVFKLTLASRPDSLNRELEKRGYEKRDETSVQILELGETYRSAMDDLEFSLIDVEEWVSVFTSLNPVTVEMRQTLGCMLTNMTGEACFGLLVQEGQPAACGLGVLIGGFLGLFDILVSSHHRGRGYGEEVVKRVLNWARGKGAHTAYLQVVVGNEKAENLYHKLGFKERYRYWYRIKT